MEPKLSDDHLVDSNDSGWRKLGLTAAGLALIAWGYWITQFSSILQGLYTVYIGAVISLVTIFMGLHIADKVQGGIINLKAYPLTNGDTPPVVTPPPAPGAADVVPPPPPPAA
jgi:hypothetical protein